PVPVGLVASLPGNPNGVGVGNLFTLQVTVVDALGRAVTGLSGPVTVTLMSAPVGGNLVNSANQSGPFTAPVSASTGVASFGNLKVTKAGLYGVRITFGNLTLSFTINTLGRQT